MEKSFTSLVIQEEVRCKGSSPKAPPPVPGVIIDVRGRVGGRDVGVGEGGGARGRETERGGDR